MKQTENESRTYKLDNYYLVSYYISSDYYRNVFVTNEKSTAIEYCSKFNRILNKWKDYYSQYEVDDFGTKWIADEHVEKHFNRWNSLQEIQECSYQEIQFRLTITYGDFSN